jgi:hypothetical protein
VRDVSLHRRVPPRSYGVAILNNLSIEYFPAPVMYSSEKPPIEQLVISRQHKECPNRDAIEGECNVDPSDTIEQYVDHCRCSFLAPL